MNKRRSNGFAILLPGKYYDKNGEYKKELINIILNKYPWLTIAGLDKPFFINGDRVSSVEYAGPDNLLTFGMSDDFDVDWNYTADWTRYNSYNNERIYDAVTQWDEAERQISNFAKSKKYYNRKNNSNDIVEYDNFYKVGYNIIPKSGKEKAYFKEPELEYYTKITIITEE